MDKNAIKKYAVWARRELISRVSQRAALYEITEKGYGDANAVSVLGRVMSADEKAQRGALIDQIREKGYEQVMEEIAYTWFNRFIALRFMEVNGYLPSHVRVFTDEENNFKPQILTEAINVDLEGLDMEKVYALKTANDDDTLFKYLIIVQCNALSSILPGMFQRISDYTELLFPDNLLREGSVIEQMVSMIPEEDWTDQVQIIGWLYQYYNTEPKDKVFENLKKNIKISKENIPAATQLFTPDWIVRYMVENSLGRLWLEGHPNDELKATWKYYLDEAEQEPDVQTQLVEIRKEYSTLKPEDILAIDPCQGSGHILAYMFDVLVQIYEAYGYTAREAAASIVERNIWGLDIDDRAAQLAYFSVMMKARQYDRRFFSRGIQPHVYAIVESNGIDPHCVEYFVDGRPELKSAMDTLIKELHDAKEYGSILNVARVDFAALYARVEEIRNEAAPNIYSFQAVETILPLVQVAQTISQKYNAVSTNPPYMAISNCSSKLNDYINNNFIGGKADLYSAFIERCLGFTQKNMFCSMITMQGWMFLKSYKKLREKMLNSCIVNMVHLGTRAFEEISGEVVQTTSFVMRKLHLPSYRASYSRLIKDKSQGEKEARFLKEKAQYVAESKRYKNTPGGQILYWIGEQTVDLFQKPHLSSKYSACHGIMTGNDEKVIFYWWEPCWSDVACGCNNYNEFVKTTKKYVPLCKGGAFKKWYGNQELVIRYDDKGIATIESQRNYSFKGKDNYFREGATWTEITSGKFGVRYIPRGMVISHKGPTIFAGDTKDVYCITGFLNSCVADYLIQIINPTISCTAGIVESLPMLGEDNWDESISRENVDIAKQDWDSFEASWDFRIHPMLPVYADDLDYAYSVSRFYESWAARCEERLKKLRTNEEELNRNFIEIYGLQEELLSEVEDKDITVRRADLQRDIKSLISYAVGCMFGRYAYDGAGLAYAGGEWDESRYGFIPVDKDNIIPICDDEYFEDDIVGRFVEFIRKAYGNATLEENLRFIADALGGSGSPRDVIRNYFINDFYADHLKIYQKRPIYWLFDSGKKNGFKCLIYMHRYQPDTIARIRTDYVHEQQSRYRTAIADLESRIANAGTGERVKLSKQRTKLQEQANELRIYEEKIHHLADQMIKIDLDDGVKANYAKFQDVLAKIK